MQNTDFDVIKYLKGYIHEQEQLLENSVNEKLYSMANNCEVRIRVLKDILREVEENSPPKEDEYVYLNEGNWMDYYGKRVQATDAVFSGRIRTGVLSGFIPGTCYPFCLAKGEGCDILGTKCFRHARVKIDKEQ